MTVKKQKLESEAIHSEHVETEAEKALPEELKTCFIIMPIADHPDYDNGHFERVYNYLIKPACFAAGYKPIRADDSKASNMIMFDILKKIVECDMAICDLSSRNANVFYELGLRQAFNKKTILITDNRQPTPFDISSFRYLTYSPSLRVDTVNNEIPAISLMLKETESASEDDLNSIVKLLQIRPAKVEEIDLNKEDSVIYNLLMKMQSQISRLSSRDSRVPPYLYSGSGKNIIKNNFTNISIDSLQKGLRFDVFEELFPDVLHTTKFHYKNKDIGFLTNVTDSELTFKNGGDYFILDNTANTKKEIFSV